jgi:hypothetical protein
MNPYDDLILTMEQILNQLVANAKKLYDVSTRVISKEELAPLQQKQEELVKHLRDVDAALEKARLAGFEVEEIVWNNIQQKLTEFQHLNEAFIANLITSRGLIQFEKKQKERKKK